MVIDDYFNGYDDYDDDYTDSDEFPQEDVTEPMCRYLDTFMEDRISGGYGD